MLKNYNKRVIIRIRGLDQDKAQYMAEDTLMMRMLVVLITILLPCHRFRDLWLNLIQYK